MTISDKCKLNIFSGIIGGLIVGAFALLAICFWSPVDLQPTRIVSNNCISQADSLSVNHLNILKDLEDKGILLTPDEYTSHVSSFYSILVAVLVGLFVVFSIISFFLINENSTRIIKEAKQEIDNSLKNQIISALGELIRDSQEFNRKVHEAASASAHHELATKDSFEELKSLIETNNKNIEDLFVYYGEIQEILSNQDEIVFSQNEENEIIS